MVGKEVLKAALPKPFFNKEIIVSNQTADDIIKEVLLSDVIFADQYKLIAPYFDDYEPNKVAANIWKFLKRNIKYVVESDAKQTTCSPAVLLSRGWGDCKHYSLFTAGVLSALGLPHFFRFTSYNVLDRQPQHVYVVMDYDSSPVIIDAVLPGFDQEKAYVYKIDKRPNKMLTRVSGIPTKAMRQKPTYSPNYIVGFDDAQVGSIFSRFAKYAGGRVKQAAKFVATEAKQVAKGVATAAKYTGKILVKVAAAPARNAFLLVVKFNLLNMAVSLYQGAKKDPQRVQNFWQGVGGDWGALKRAINSGIKNKVKGGSLAGIGIAPAAAIGLATPLIVAVAELLKSLGIGNKQVTDAANSGLQQIQQQAAQQADNGSAYGNNPGGGEQGLDNQSLDYGETQTDVYKSGTNSTANNSGSNALDTAGQGLPIGGIVLAGGLLVLAISNNKKKR